MFHVCSKQVGMQNMCSCVFVFVGTSAERRGQIGYFLCLTFFFSISKVSCLFCNKIRIYELDPQPCAVCVCIEELVLQSWVLSIRLESWVSNH